MDSRADELMELCEECKKMHRNIMIGLYEQEYEICPICKSSPIPGSKEHRNYDREEYKTE